MKKILYFLLLLFPFITQAQTWSKIYLFPQGSSDLGTNVKSTNDGGFVITGGDSGHLMKVDANGTILFRQFFADVSQAVDIVEANDGGFCILAFQEQLIAQDIFEMELIRTDENGMEQWRKTLEVDPGNVKLISTQIGGFAIQGSRSGKGDFIFYVLDASGDLLYQSNNGVGSRFIQLSNGDFVFVNNFSGGIPSNVNLVYLDAEGALVWQRESPGLRAVQQLSEGNLIVSSIKPTGQVKALSKYDLEGNLIWEKTYPELPGFYYQRIMNRLLVNDRDEIAFPTLLGDGRVQLAKFDKEGNLLCFESYTLNNYEVVFEGLDGTLDFGFIISGRATRTNALHNNNDLFLIRTDSLCQSKAFEIVNVIEPEVEAPPIEFSYQYYPNPSSEVITFEIQAEEAAFENLELTFFDILGRVVHRQATTKSFSEVKLNNLPSGSYYFVLYEGNKKRGNGKIILTKL